MGSPDNSGDDNNIITMNKTKIIATLGPSSDDYSTITALIKAGMDVARLNFSHGTHDYHQTIIDIVRKTSSTENIPITIMQDLQGPKMRVGLLPSNGITLKEGENLKIKICPPDAAPDFTLGDQKTIVLEIPEALGALQPGKHILLDDGSLEFEVTDRLADGVMVRVLLGGILTSHKGVNLPGTSLNIEGFTVKDKEDLLFGLKAGVDIVAISFVKHPDDIHKVRNFILEQTHGKREIPIIAKIELPEAIINLEEILNIADGVMVARGDLGVETSFAKVPIIQKQIIHAANRKAKLVITATQMLDSMIKNPRPTRAEASDVANAIFDGTDAVMLSGETASGAHPIESVRVMESIISEAELSFSQWVIEDTKSDWITEDDAFALSKAARELAFDRDVHCVAVFTKSGRSAVYQSKARPHVPIHVFTPDLNTYRRLNILWGVEPHLVEFSNSLEEMVYRVEKTLRELNIIQSGQKVVITSGFPIDAVRATNLALLYTIK